MEIKGNYARDGYTVLRGLLPPVMAQEQLALIKIEVDRSGLPTQFFMKPGSMLRQPAFEIHSHQLGTLISFQSGLTSTMSQLTGCDLLPTYCYFRVYRGDDVCWVHSDRFACEHSVTLTLGYSDDKTWPFEIGHTVETANRPTTHDFAGETYDTVEMQPGDAILYKGIVHRHGRMTPNPNRWSAHLFLHWVDSAGAYANEAFDGRQPFGPASFFA